MAAAVDAVTPMDTRGAQLAYNISLTSAIDAIVHVMGGRAPELRNSGWVIARR